MVCQLHNTIKLADGILDTTPIAPQAAIQLERFNRTLYLKKKYILVVNSYPILSQKNEDITVIAENKFREIRIIFISKKIAIEKVTRIKEQISDLELMEFRYRDKVRRLGKKIINKTIFK